MDMNILWQIDVDKKFQTTIYNKGVGKIVRVYDTKAYGE